MSLYMFRALNAHLQRTHCMYTVCPPEDEHLRLKTCRGT